MGLGKLSTALLAASAALALAPAQEKGKKKADDGTQIRVAVEIVSRRSCIRTTRSP